MTDNNHTSDCIFCKIIRGDIPSEKILETDSIYAFLSIGPINKGHTLVIPKEHYADMFDCPSDVFSDVMKTVYELAPKVRDAVGASGVNLGMNNGVASGQEVFHMHAHIIPRFDEDNFEFWPNKEYDSTDEMHSFGEKIRQQIE